MCACICISCGGYIYVLAVAMIIYTTIAGMYYGIYIYTLIYYTTMLCFYTYII